MTFRWHLLVFGLVMGVHRPNLRVDHMNKWNQKYDLLEKKWRFWKEKNIMLNADKKDNYYRQQKSGWHARWAPQRDVCKALLNIIVVSLLWAQQLLELVAPNGYRKPGPHFAGIYWDTSIYK